MAHNLFLLSAPGGMEWVYILILVVVLFGGKKIPELMRGVGKGMKEFNDAKDGKDSPSDPNEVEKK